MSFSVKAADEDHVPKISRCEFELTHPTYLLQTVWKNHQFLTSRKFRLAYYNPLAYRPPRLLGQALGLRFSNAYEIFYMNISESEEGYRIVIENAEKTQSKEFLFEMPPLSVRVGLGLSKAQVESLIRRGRLSLEDLGRQGHPLVGIFEEEFSVRLKGEPSLYLGIHQRLNRLELGVEFPCGRNLGGAFEVFQVRTEAGWQCLYPLLIFKGV